MTKYQKILLSTVTAIFIWSAINPHDYFTWFLEVVPAIIGFILLAATYKKFRFSNVTYTLIALHAVILMVVNAKAYYLKN
jgi:putative membrane protein